MRTHLEAAERRTAARLLLLALLLVLTLGGALAADCEEVEVSPDTPFIDGLRLEGPETTHSCGARSYKDCYNQCICNHLNSMENSTHPDCLFVNYWTSHARCGGKALCQQLTQITRPVPTAGVRGGLAAWSSRVELDAALGTRLSMMGAWIDADPGMLINKNSCNPKATYDLCQLQCVMNTQCVAWMHGVDDDWVCGSPLATCPNKPLKGCKRGYCLLFSSYYKVLDWQADDEIGHPGNFVGVIPGRPNPAAPRPNPRDLLTTNMGDMYNGAVEAPGLSHAAAVGFSLPALAFDFGAAVRGGSCDAAGNCAHNLACDLFVGTATECSALCVAANEKASTTLDALLARSDVNRSALEAAGQPTCKFYRWTEKEQSCGASGLKKGECLLMSHLAGVRPRRSGDNNLKRVFGVLDMNELPKLSPPPSPRPPPPSPPAPPPPGPPISVALDIGIGGTSKQQFGPAKQTHVGKVLEQNSGGGATASIVSINNVPNVKFGQQRSLLASGILIRTRLLFPKRQAAKARQFAWAVAAGGKGTAWVKQISQHAAIDSSSVRLQGQQVLLLPPPSPSPQPPPPPSPPPRGTNSGSGGRAGGGGRPGSVRPVQGRSAMEVEAAAALAATPCASVFFSLPKLLVAGTPHLAAFSDASPEANAAWARAYCQQRNSSFGAAGTVRRGVLPPPLAGHAAAVLTYSPADGRTCIGRDCPFVAVVECVPAGAEPCTADEQGNVGVGNTGWHNVGHYNAGSNNLGSRNSGSGNMGDMNAASGCVGSYNSADGSFGFEGSGSLVAPALRQHLQTP